MTAVAVSRSVRRPAPRPAPIPIIGLILVTAILALYGAEVASGAFRAAERSPAVGMRLATSFGSVTIEQTQVMGSSTSHDMWNGMTRGIQDLVPVGEAQVAISVFIDNEAGWPTPVEAGQFRLHVEGRRVGAMPTSGTILPMRLQPGTGVRGTLVFVVPLDGARASVVFQDPGGAPIAIPVGQLHQAPPPELGHPVATAHDE